MAFRRVSWLRAAEVHQELTNTTCHDNDENAKPMLGGEAQNLQELHILVRCPPRHHPRYPLGDITHLYPGNIAQSDDKFDMSSLVTQAQENGRVRRFPSRSPQTPRKRRRLQSVSESLAVRSVLRKTFR